LYKRKDGKWAWNLKADNGQIIATDGGQGYDNEPDARDMADRIIGGEFKEADKRIIKPTDRPQIARYRVGLQVTFPRPNRGLASRDRYLIVRHELGAN